MSTESIGLVVVLSILALGTLYAAKGSLVSEQWWAWIRGACYAAATVFAIGMFGRSASRSQCLWKFSSHRAENFRPTARGRSPF